MLTISTKGFQKVPFPNVPLWHMDYFELKAMENQHMQEKPFTSSNLQIFQISICKNVLYQEESYSQGQLITRETLVCST